MLKIKQKYLYEIRNNLIDFYKKQIDVLKKEFEDKIPNLINS